LNIVLLAMLESGSNFIEADQDVVRVFHKKTNDLLKLKLVDSNDQVVSLENLELRLIHRQVKVDSQ
ncbi:transcriptional regulator, partial [Acinetobacter pittii]